MKRRMLLLVVAVAVSMGILLLTTASRAQVRMSSPAVFPAVFPWFRADQVDSTYDEKGNERIVGRQTVEQHQDGTLTIVSPVSWLGNLLHTRRVINTNGIAESFLGPIPFSLSSGASVESWASLQRALGKIPENCMIHPSEERILGTTSLHGLVVFQIERTRDDHRVVTSKAPEIGCFILERMIFRSSSKRAQSARKTVIFELRTSRL